MPKRAAAQSSKHPQDRRQPRQFSSGVGKVGSKNAEFIIHRPSAGLASQASASPSYAVCVLRSLPLILTAELCFYTSISETWNGEFASIAFMKICRRCHGNKALNTNLKNRRELCPLYDISRRGIWNYLRKIINCYQYGRQSSV